MKRIDKFLFAVGSGLVCAVLLFYYYYFQMEHPIVVKTQVAANARDTYQISASCQSIEIFTFAPFVSVRLNGVEILRTSVNPGYDTLGDCMRSSVSSIYLNEAENLVVVVMKEGMPKELELVSRGPK